MGAAQALRHDIEEESRGLGTKVHWFFQKSPSPTRNSIRFQSRSGMLGTRSSDRSATFPEALPRARSPGHQVFLQSPLTGSLPKHFTLNPGGASPSSGVRSLVGGTVGRWERAEAQDRARVL